MEASNPNNNSNDNEKDNDNKNTNQNQDSDMIVKDNVRNMDVLFGRGGYTNNHLGNRLFRRLIRYNREAYIGTEDPSKKQKLIKSVISSIEGKGGRFLHLRGGDWVPVPPRLAHRKAGQCFRETRSPLQGETSFLQEKTDPLPSINRRPITSECQSGLEMMNLLEGADVPQEYEKKCWVETPQEVEDDNEVVAWADQSEGHREDNPHEERKPPPTKRANDAPPKDRQSALVREGRHTGRDLTKADEGAVFPLVAAATIALSGTGQSPNEEAKTNRISFQGPQEPYTGGSSRQHHNAIINSQYPFGLSDDLRHPHGNTQILSHRTAQILSQQTTQILPPQMLLGAASSNPMPPPASRFRFSSSARADIEYPGEGTSQQTVLPGAAAGNPSSPLRSFRQFSVARSVAGHQVREERGSSRRDVRVQSRATQDSDPLEVFLPELEEFLRREEKHSG